MLHAARLGLRNLAGVLLGVLFLAAVERAVAALLSLVSVALPSSVAGMLLAFAVLLGLREQHGERCARWLEPARLWLGRWMALFFVPPLVSLPLLPRPELGLLLQLLLVLVGGFLTTLLVTALFARLLTPGSAPAASHTPPVRCWWRTRSLLVVWGTVTLLGALGCILQTEGPARVMFGLGVTVSSFVVAEALRAWLTARGLRRVALVSNPVLLTAAASSAAWCALGLPLADYLATRPRTSPGALLMLPLAPAVVALGLALYRERRLLYAVALPLVMSTLLASLGSLVGTAWVAHLLGLPSLYARALLPRGVTTPVALNMAAALGANGGLTAAFVISNGVLGAMLAAPLLERVGLAGPFTLGVATGASSHGIGTAALLREHPESGAIAGIAFALTASFSALLVSIAPLRALLLWLCG